MIHKDDKLSINFLDHVALRVKNLDVSANWYEKVLGLKKYQLKEWGPYPIFLLAGKSGIALFPANPDDPKLHAHSRNVKIDHLAFNVDNENYNKAKKIYTDLNIPFKEEDHHYFHSIYTEDPDGHTVELTTILVEEMSFYKL